ncbi:MAG TPA: site-2 protease family protein [Thermoanaerobaculia bacterium]
MEHKVIDFAIQLAVILFSISFHESAHAWSALRFGDTTARDLGRISLNPIRHIDPVGSIVVPLVLYFTTGFIFGSAKPTPVDLRNTRNPRLANLVVSAAGPLSNFLLAGVGLLAFEVIKRTNRQAMIDLYEALQFGHFGSGVMAPITYLLFFFVLVNVMLGVFNLIPIPPLDGSGVLLSVGGPPVARVFEVIRPFGFIILLLLVMSPILGRILLPIQRSVQILIFSGLS